MVFEGPILHVVLPPFTGGVSPSCPPTYGQEVTDIDSGMYLLWYGFSVAEATDCFGAEYIYSGGMTSCLSIVMCHSIALIMSRQYDNKTNPPQKLPHIHTQSTQSHLI